MRIYDIIEKKKHALELSEEEIRFAVRGFVDGSVADYQMSALTMAIYFNSMTDRETYFLTKEMMESGDTVDLSLFGRLSVDKHSTGGVGDKTTLIIAPIVASLGCKVAKMSGRGLGFTGGTVDKLESLRGYKTTLSSKGFLSQVEKIGVCVIGQSGNLVPADKKLYALRDVTATVDSIPLIASSIMSKKLASGSRSIVLDVKCGSGAFMKSASDAKHLAEAMINIGKGFGRNVSALITNMDIPLGYAVGNRTEVYEAISVLSGNGESGLTEICVALASCMVSMALDISREDAKKRVLESISSGAALSKFKEWVVFQGGDGTLVDNPSLLLEAKYKKCVFAPRDGYISKIDAEGIGIASMMLGAGRAKKDDDIDFTAGILMKARYGSFVKKGDVIAQMLTSNECLFESAGRKLADAVSLNDKMPPKATLIYEIL